MSFTPTYRVSTVLSSPFVMAKDGGGYEGFIVDLLDKVAEYAGFKYTMFQSEDRMYGSILPNGSWNGMIGELVHRKVDIAAAALTITSERARVVDFTKPFMSDSRRLLVKRPTPMPESGRLGFLLEPFSAEVWFCIVLALVIVAILFMLIGRFNPYEWRQVPSDKDPRGARHSFGLRESLMFVFSTLTFQGYRETPRSLSGRVLAVFWFISVFLTVVAYIGNVTSFCLAGTGSSRMVMPFESIEDLSRQTHIKVGIIKSGGTAHFLRQSKIEEYKRLYSFIEVSGSYVRTNDEGIARVLQSSGDFVMLMESSVGEYAAERNCDLMMYGPGISQFGFGFATPIGSALRERINLALLELTEKGTVQMLHNKWWKKGTCPSPQLEKRKDDGIAYYARVLGIRRMAAPFFILLIGAVLSVLALIGEIVFNKLRQ